MEYVDCSHPLESEPGAYPGDPPVEIEPHATHDKDGYRVTRLAMGSHSGTHIDAPNHLLPDGLTLDEYPIETFTFDAIRVSIPDLDSRQPIVRADLPDVSDADLADVDLLAIHTGWDRHWGTKSYLDHPFLTPDLAQWLADRNCHVGIDAISVDPTPTENAVFGEPEGFPAHRALLGADRLIVENLTRLADVPEQFSLLAFPLSLPDGDGAPVRAVARFPES